MRSEISVQNKKEFSVTTIQEWTGLMWFHEYLIPNASILKVQSIECYTKIRKKYNWHSIYIKEDSTCLVEERVTCGLYILWVNGWEMDNR